MLNIFVTILLLVNAIRFIHSSPLQIQNLQDITVNRCNQNEDCYTANRITMPSDLFAEIKPQDGKKEITETYDNGYYSTLCWVEILLIHEIPSNNTIYATKEYSIILDSPADIPNDKLDNSNSLTSEFSSYEIYNRNTKKSRKMVFKKIKEENGVIIKEHKEFVCGSGPVLHKTLTVWPNSQKKRIEIKVSPKNARLEDCNITKLDHGTLPYPEHYPPLELPNEPSVEDIDPVPGDDDVQPNYGRLSELSPYSQEMIFPEISNSQETHQDIGNILNYYGKSKPVPDPFTVQNQDVVWPDNSWLPTYPEQLPENAPNFMPTYQDNRPTYEDNLPIYESKQVPDANLPIFDDYLSRDPIPIQSDQDIYNVPYKEPTVNLNEIKHLPDDFIHMDEEVPDLAPKDEPIVNINKPYKRPEYPITWPHFPEEENLIMPESKRPAPSILDVSYTNLQKTPESTTPSWLNFIQDKITVQPDQGGTYSPYDVRPSTTYTGIYGKPGSRAPSWLRPDSKITIKPEKETTVSSTVEPTMPSTIEPTFGYTEIHGRPESTTPSELHLLQDKITVQPGQGNTYSPYDVRPFMSYIKKPTGITGNRAPLLSPFPEGSTNIEPDRKQPGMSFKVPTVKYTETPGILESTTPSQKYFPEGEITVQLGQEKIVPSTIEPTFIYTETEGRPESTSPSGLNFFQDKITVQPKQERTYSPYNVNPTMSYTAEVEGDPKSNTPFWVPFPKGFTTMKPDQKQPYMPTEGSTVRYTDTPERTESTSPFWVPFGKGPTTMRPSQEQTDMSPKGSIFKYTETPEGSESTAPSSFHIINGPITTEPDQKEPNMPFKESTVRYNKTTEWPEDMRPSWSYFLNSTPIRQFNLSTITARPKYYTSLTPDQQKPITVFTETSHLPSDKTTLTISSPFRQPKTETTLKTYKDDGITVTTIRPVETTPFDISKINQGFSVVTQPQVTEQGFENEVTTVKLSTAPQIVATTDQVTKRPVFSKIFLYNNNKPIDDDDDEDDMYDSVESQYDVKKDTGKPSVKQLPEKAPVVQNDTVRKSTRQPFAPLVNESTESELFAEHSGGRRHGGTEDGQFPSVSDIKYSDCVKQKKPRLKVKLILDYGHNDLKSNKNVELLHYNKIFDIDDLPKLYDLERIGNDVEFMKLLNTLEPYLRNPERDVQYVNVAKPLVFDIVQHETKKLKTLCSARSKETPQSVTPENVRINKTIDSNILGIIRKNEQPLSYLQRRNKTMIAINIPSSASSGAKKFNMTTIKRKNTLYEPSYNTTRNITRMVNAQTGNANNLLGLVRNITTLNKVLNISKPFEIKKNMSIVIKPALKYNKTVTFNVTSSKRVPNNTNFELHLEGGGEKPKLGLMRNGSVIIKEKESEDKDEGGNYKVRESVIKPIEINRHYEVHKLPNDPVKILNIYNMFQNKSTAKAILDELNRNSTMKQAFYKEFETVTGRPVVTFGKGPSYKYNISMKGNGSHLVSNLNQQVSPGFTKYFKYQPNGKYSVGNSTGNKITYYFQNNGKFKNYTMSKMHLINDTDKDAMKQIHSYEINPGKVSNDLNRNEKILKLIKQINSLNVKNKQDVDNKNVDEKKAKELLNNVRIA